MKENKCIQLVRLPGSGGTSALCWQGLSCQHPSLCAAAVSHGTALPEEFIVPADSGRRSAPRRQMECICQSLSLIINFCHSEQGNISLPDPLRFDPRRHLRDGQANLPSRGTRSSGGSVCRARSSVHTKDAGKGTLCSPYPLCRQGSVEVRLLTSTEEQWWTPNACKVTSPCSAAPRTFTTLIIS